ncbi:MAG: DUF4861 domain-containing protein, partial [bacterium]|nr:DUF4861 domain-containing protein [bacterium]
HRGIVIREYPSQADDLDGDGVVDEIVFPMDFVGTRLRECFVYYAPEGVREADYPAQTNAVDGINEVTLGWESEICGFRSYYGKFDFFGKKIDGLRLDNLGAYHEDADWGMDVLHVGPAPGVGGLSFWQDDTVYRAYNEEKTQRCELTQSIVSDGPVRAAIRIDMRGFDVAGEKADVSILASTYANQLYSEQRVTVTPSDGTLDDGILLSTGVVAIDGVQASFDKEAGALSLWGDQGDPIVGELGQAVIAPAGLVQDAKGADHSEELLLQIPEDGRVTLFAVGEWHKAQGDQRRLVAHSAPEWAKQVGRLAGRVLNPIRVEVRGPAEDRF